MTYGPRADDTEHFVVASKREKNAKPGIFQFRQCFLPTSRFAGPCPLKPHTNELISHDRKWFYSAFHFRSTFFDLYPAKTPEAKGAPRFDLLLVKKRLASSGPNSLATNKGHR